MKHHLAIYYSPKPKENGDMRVRNVVIREKFLSWLCGPKRKLTIIVPGDSVDTVEINEIQEETE